MLKTKKILVVGFGRVWKLLCRQLIDTFESIHTSRLELIILNRTNDLSQLKYLFKYDSVYWKIDIDISGDSDTIYYKNSSVRFINSPNLEEAFLHQNIDLAINSTPSKKIAEELWELWKKYSITIFHTNHKKWLKNLVYGVNDNIDWSIKQNVTCTICDVSWTAGVIQRIAEEFKINFLSFMSIHPALAYQNILDKTLDQESAHWWVGQHNLSRSFFNNIIPKNTTAWKALEDVVGISLENKILSYSIRIPTTSVTMADIVMETKNDINKSEVIEALVRLQNENDSIFLEYDQITSLDIIRTQYLSVVYMDSLQVLNKHIKMTIFYDNEWWYITNVVRLAWKALFY